MNMTKDSWGDVTISLHKPTTTHHKSHHTKNHKNPEIIGNVPRGTSPHHKILKQ